MDRVCTRHGGTLGAGAEVLCEIVAFACMREHGSQLVFSESLVWVSLVVLCKDVR